MTEPLAQRLRAHVVTLRERLKQYDRVRNAYHSLDLLRKYGTFRPDRVTMAGSSNVIFVDSSEPRGRALARGYCRGQPGLKALWRRAIDRLGPDIVVDVGANYGEFVFLPTYGDGTRVIAVEPHPALRSYLTRSRDVHPNAGSIELVFALASDAPGEETSFYVDEAWSGRSSALRDAKQRRVREFRVPVTSVDEIVGAANGAKTLLFKIDVEGYEPRVLQGMERVLDAAPRSVGIVELHSGNLRKFDLDLNAYLERLSRRFTIYTIDRAGAPKRVSPTSLALAFPEQDFSTDLLLLGRSELASELGLT